MVSTYISVTLGVVDNSAWSRRLRRRIHPLLCAMERELEYKPHGVLGRLFNLLLAVLVLEYRAGVVADNFIRHEPPRRRVLGYH